MLKVLLLLSGAVYCGNMDSGSVSPVSEECIEDDDSEDDYASIQRPAFQVDGEPNFDSGPPEDGWEYLRRVRYCCNSYLPIAGPLADYML
jgi:survival of motor neuron protein-interacting protein 1